MQLPALAPPASSGVASSLAMAAVCHPCLQPGEVMTAWDFIAALSPNVLGDGG